MSEYTRVDNTGVLVNVRLKILILTLAISLYSNLDKSLFFCYFIMIFRLEEIPRPNDLGPDISSGRVNRDA